MTVFMIQPENPLKFGTMIEAFDGASRMPAVLVSNPRNGFPIEALALAENFTHLLNGGRAPNALDSKGAAIHYFKHAHGVTLQLRDNNGGVSSEGLYFTLLETVSDPVRDALMSRITPDMMQTLCGAIDMKSAPAQQASHTRKQDFKP
jgi:hypothetical protein